MQNTNLKCNATNCAFNQRMECSAGAINIRGTEAVTTDGTTCSSYVDRNSNSFTNSVNSAKTNTYNISCEACKCAYNENKNCTADNVSIDANTASCDTFIRE
ncbi:DUF1540 domain-containing protein [Terrisporobacter petrolearius]|uniref:DUF1540 domain-containing protein n=1 Tax=Terrisporobacter petrolearius TaxID=1460447 RepID=UPI001D16A269|nr:DUF1540 domain-containing protein [Terrisporobacter petrolearius]MCC3863603.1 DUF1540 domain-containing protein [Terrisporobacter petrolearius]